MHISIIMDGNRRYAEKKNLFPKFMGHVAGKKALEKLLLNWIKMKEPKYLTLFAFSVFNLKKRNPIEKAFIFKLLEHGFRELLSTKEIFTEKIRISFIGRKQDCPKSLAKLMEQIEDKTKKHSKKFLNFCICYDGQEEIANAFNTMLSKKLKKADEKTIKKNLYTRNLPPVDLLVRTGGEKRLSGFLLWDASYAEIIFRDENWPEYNIALLKQDMTEFKNRKRRFGK